MRALGATLVLVGLAAGCAADAEPLESDLIVTHAGPAAPVSEGARCLLRMQPAWRQGVNCQVVLRCPASDGSGEVDLFGGRRPGGYAVCETDDGAFTSALDDEPRTDGDPALHVDLAAGVVTWRDRDEGERATLRVEGEPRVAAAW